MYENNDIRKIKHEILKFTVLVIFVIAIFLLIIFLATPKQEQTMFNNSNFFTIKGIEHGFIYYNGDVYYKNPNLIILDINKVGESIGKNEKHIKKADVIDNEIQYNEETLCVYAEPLTTSVYSYTESDDILLIESDYAINSYFVYVKNITPSEDEYKDLDYFINNENNYSIELISYGMQPIDIDFKLSDLVAADNNISDLYSSGLSQGKMVFYLVINDNGLNYAFEGTGNILSNIITFASNNGNVKYRYKNEKLSEILTEIYADFFGINTNNIDDVLDSIQMQDSETTNREETITEEPPTQNDEKQELLPLQ